MMNRKHQGGVSLVGMLLLGVIAVFVLLMVFRTVPAVTEYLAIERIVGVLASEGDNGATAAELRRSFDRRGQIDDISSVRGADLVIDRTGTRTVINVQYSRTVPLVANVSLLFDLHPSSDSR